MRTFIITIGIVLVCAAALAVYVVATTPEDAPPLRYPLTSAQLELVKHVPPSADAWAYVAAPAVLTKKLAANPVTSDAMLRWNDEQPLPPASLLGRADAVVWRQGKTTAYAVRFDPVRAWIAHLWTLMTHMETEWEGSTLLLGATAEAAPAGAIVTDEIRMSAGLPPGDALIVQRTGGRGAFPPLRRPTVTTVLLSPSAIELTSRGLVSEGPRPSVAQATTATLPKGAMLSATFTRPPRVLGDVDRLVAADVEALLAGGGSLALYDVDTGTLLPRPFGVIVLAASESSRESLSRYSAVVDAVGERRDLGDRLLVAFDRKSAGRYVADAQAPMPWPANEWSLRVDPVRLVPVLREVGDNPAVRFAAPRVHRGARDLRRWMGALEKAGIVEAAASVNGDFEELRVRVATK